METKPAAELSLSVSAAFPNSRKSRGRPPYLPPKPKTPKSAFSFDRALVRTLDVSISLVAMIYLLPIFVIVAVIIKFQDAGPVFFVQRRVGRNGKAFNCYKLRTMRCNADALFRQYLDANPNEAANWLEFRKLDNDPRVTPFGAFLRKTSIDEFPQLINVLKGEMSLVGPRPIMHDEVGKYRQSFRAYASVLPGITGLWQVMGRSNVNYSRRVAMDRLYARKTSAGFYLVILVLTIPAVLLQKGSR